MNRYERWVAEYRPKPGDRALLRDLPVGTYFRFKETRLEPSGAGFCRENVKHGDSLVTVSRPRRNKPLAFRKTV